MVRIRKEAIVLRRYGLVSVFVLCGFSAMAQERMPWQLSIDERLALRHELANKLAAQPRVQSTQRDGKPPARFVLDGRETPELFLRTELMAFLLSEFGDHENGARVLETYRPMLVDEFKWSPEAFWRDFEAASVSYFQADAGENDEAAAVPICRARMATLSEMVKRYPRFEEFLYRALAPRSVMASNQIVTVDHLRWLEEGCP